MTKLEELESAYHAAWAVALDADTAYEAVARVADAAYDAYQAELNKGTNK